MLRKLKNNLLVLSVLVASLVPVLVPLSASAAIQDSLNCGADLQFTEKDCAVNSEDGSSLNKVITNIINLFSVVVGVVAVVMIIIGGFRYITSGGEAAAVTGAKNTILYAVVGLIIVAFAQVIVKFVLAKSTGASG